MNTNHENFQYFDPKRYLYDLAVFVQNRNLTDVEILIPRVVFEDLKYHQNSHYQDVLAKLNSTFSRFVDLSNFKLEIPEDFDYLAHINSLGTAFFAKYGMKILETPNKDLTKKFVERVISRKKPFYKKKSDKDAGFKDTIIWESILDYAEQNPDRSIVLWTDDSDFIADYLLNEFANHSKAEILIFKSSSDIEAFLDKEYALKENLSEFIASVNDQNFNEPVRNALFNQYNAIEFTGHNWKITDFMIEEISDISYDKKKATYSITLEVMVEHETPYTGYAFMDNTYAPYEYETLETRIKVEASFIDGKINILDVSAIYDHLKKLSY